MEKETQVEVQEQHEEVVDYKAMYESLAAEKEAILAKQTELLDEAKSAKKAKEEVKKRAEKEQEEIARKNGEFEKLLQLSEQRQKDVENRYQELLNGIKNEKIKNASMKIASELANKPENAELLSHFLEMKLSSLADDNGQVSDDVMSSLKKDFMSDKKFSSLVAGRQSTGGGAPGSGQVKQQTSMTRAEFDNLHPTKQYEFVAKIRQGQATLTD